METEEIAAKYLHDNQAEILNRISYQGKCFTITKHGKKTAVIMSYEEYEQLASGVDSMDDEQDSFDAVTSFKECQALSTISLSELAKELDIEL